VRSHGLCEPEGGAWESATGSKVTRVPPESKLTSITTADKVSARLFKVRALLRDACDVFRQKCIYLSIAGKVELVEGPVHEGE